jgi:hypothetical protein
VRAVFRMVAWRKISNWPSALQMTTLRCFVMFFKQMNQRQANSNGSITPAGLALTTYELSIGLMLLFFF